MSKEVRNNHIKLTASASSSPLEELAVRQNDRQTRRSEIPLITVGLVLVFLYGFSVAFFIIPAVSKPDLAYFVTACAEKFQSFTAFISGGVSGYSVSTLVRYTVVVLAGAALSVSGAVFQGSFRNIIASPTTMGVQSGAMLGNALYLLLFTVPTTGVLVVRYDNEAYYALNVFQQNLQQIFALLGSFVAIVLVIFITKALGKGRFSSGNILFSGLVFSAFVGSITNIIQYYFLFSDMDNSRLNVLRAYSMGTFDRVLTPVHLAVIAAVLIPCLAAMLAAASRLNALVLGEEEAYSMGINVKRFKRFIIAVGTLMAGVVYAFCGSIGFMGFIVPQIARRLAGPDFRRLLLMCVLLGGIIMLLVYNAALYMGLSAYLNIITSVIGCTMMAISLFWGKGARMYE